MNIAVNTSIALLTADAAVISRMAAVHFTMSTDILTWQDQRNDFFTGNKQPIAATIGINPFQF